MSSDVGLFVVHLLEKLIVCCTKKSRNGCICPDSDSERTAPQAVETSWTRVQSEADRQGGVRNAEGWVQMASASIYTLVKIRCSCVAFEKELLVYPYHPTRRASGARRRPFSKCALLQRIFPARQVYATRNSESRLVLRKLSASSG